jgi:hypothetical protein
VTPGEEGSLPGPAPRAGKVAVGGGLARVAFVAGAIAIGLFLFRAAPREVTLVYAVADRGAREVDVEILKGGETVRHAELRLGAGELGRGQVSHAVRLTDGDYLLRVTVAGEGGSRRVERAITVAESGTIVLPLGP